MSASAPPSPPWPSAHRARRPSRLALGCGVLLALQALAVAVGWFALRGWLPSPPDRTPAADILNRAGATVTPLADGQFLVAGGLRVTGGAQTTLATAARYDPATDTWRSVAAMATARWGHTATLLPDGRVLVAGGGTENRGYAASADLYDPRADRWSPAGSLATARQGHTATLLDDGRVLVVGGAAGQHSAEEGPFASAELYNPATNGWTPAASLARTRLGHTATRLADGQVLVVGGNSPFDAVPPAERYDPAADRWGDAGVPAFTRQGHRAALLPDGRVLVAGGETTTGVRQRAMSRNARTIPDGELYDPVANAWRPTGALGTARSGHSLTVLPGGAVLAAGGADNDGRLLDTAERYDPATGRWRDAGRLTTARSGHTAALLPGGEVLLLGGRTREDPARARVAARYDPATGRWRASGDTAATLAARTPTPAAVGVPVAAPAAPHTGGTATSLADGRVLLVGGGEVAAPGVAVEWYDPAAGRWASAAPLPEPRAGHTATLLPDGRVLVVGGETAGGGLAGAALYDPRADTWTVVAPPPAPASGHTATLLRDGRVLVVGGRGADGAGHRLPLADAALYDPAANRWAATTRLSVARAGHTATLLADGRVLLVGGNDDYPGERTIELYDPAAGRWRPAAPLAEARSHHTATLLRDGQALVVGGDSHAGQYHYRADAERYDPLADR